MRSILTALVVCVLSSATASVASAAKMGEAVASMKSDFHNSSAAGRKIGKLAQHFQANGDRRGQFAHIYAITIAATVQTLKNGGFENPKWVESLITNYANIYRKTVYKELTGRRSELPVAWQYEFDFVESDRWMATFDAIYGIKVHITRDLVEALYITPTNYEKESIRRDFFRISTVLKSAMPDIWNVYLYYSQSGSLASRFTQASVYDWIARLRARAWEDARKTAGLSGRQKAKFLSELDRESKRVRHFGILTLFH